ncbi:MAG TPA: glycoside hydrolase family 31 protein, partial [bacterium]|nr:glycoside hydrolase family 31 protein [bacterium]
RKTGVDGWWTDLVEPEWDSDDMVFRGGLRRNAVHNAQAILMHKSIADMYRRELPDERLFILSRSGFVGDWRYGVGIWSGDIHSTWFQFTDQVPIAINANLSGFGLWNSDIGGFVETPTEEMFIRWIQFGAFCPIMRPHGDSTREPWMYGPEAERINREIINLRYRLSPYLYTMFREMHEHGRPTMRAMLLEFPDDPKTYNINDQYMYGPWLLVAPVTKQNLTKRKVYLPEGGWTDFWTDETVAGPRTVSAAAPLNRIPLFVRPGAIIPMAPLMQFTGQRPIDPLTIHIYPAASASSYDIYEDDGATNRYLKGEFAVTSVKTSPGPAASVSVSRSGKYSGMPARRAYVIVYHHASAPESITLDGKPVRKTSADIENVAPKKAAWSYDAGARKLRIFVPARAAGFQVKISSQGD